MTVTTTKHSTVPQRGIKAALEDVLKTRAEREDAAGVPRTGMTLGEIVSALGLDKTRNSEVSAALIKVRDQGKIRSDTGPATSKLGARFVKRYRWALKKAAEPTVTQEAVDADLRRALSQMR